MKQYIIAAVIIILILLFMRSRAKKAAALQAQQPSAPLPEPTVITQSGGNGSVITTETSHVTETVLQTPGGGTVQAAPPLVL